MRAQSAGAVPRVEDAVAKGLRLQQEHKVRREREDALSSPQASIAVQQQIGVIFETLEQLLLRLRPALPDSRTEWHVDQAKGFEIRRS